MVEEMRYIKSVILKRDYAFFVFELGNLGTRKLGFAPQSTELA